MLNLHLERARRLLLSLLRKKIDRFGARGILVWGCIMLGNHTPLHVFHARIINADRYRDDILEAYMRLLRGAFGPDFLFMGDNERPHRTQIVDDSLEKEDFRHMD